jgi:hypothetical protein
LNPVPPQPEASLTDGDVSMAPGGAKSNLKEGLIRLCTSG